MVALMKLFSIIKQEDVKEQFKEVNERMAQSAFKAQFVSSLISPFVSLVTYLTIGAASVVGCIFVMQGSITVGEFTSIYSLYLANK